jgi:hypothetical protein
MKPRMKPRMKSRWGLAVAALALASGASLLTPVLPVAAADPIGDCTTTVGTIVAVDFAHWGGPLVRGCGVDQPTGFALLHAAGFSTAGDNHDGPAYVCRMGNEAFQSGAQYPTVAQDRCIVTPPVTAYWSYWLAPAGQSSWSYSSRGATTDVPRPGEVELWTFGDTDVTGSTGSGVPTFNPDSLRARNPAPTAGTVPDRAPTTRPSATPTSGVTVSPGAVGGPSSTTPPAQADVGVTTTGPSRPLAGAAPHSNGSTTVAGTSTSVAAPTPTTRPGPPTRIVDALPAVNQRASSGSIVPLLVAVVLIAVLAAVATGTLWRRRQQE